MNNKKICFITCVNDERQYKECLLFINNLRVPDSYEIEIITVKDADCMTRAYNKAMKNTDAKYKVYLHQDTFIINKNFIYDILKIFNSNDRIGMIGVAGAKTIPAHGMWWYSNHRIGQVYDSYTAKLKLLKFSNINNDYENTKIVDGLMMTTQYDVSWREDLFDGWHFYDVSQSLEFLRAGYEVVIPRQESCWCIHDCGIINFSNGYEKYRQIFVNEYSKECS